MGAAQVVDDGFELVGKDLIPLLEVDFAIEDARSLYKTRGPVLFMTTPWWEKTNRHLLINHLTKLYEYCTKHRLPYLDCVRFNNRTVYHLHATGRAVVREMSQSIGSTTLRAHFKQLHGQFSAARWSELYETEARFFAAQRVITGTLDPMGAITRLGNKRVYSLWETLHSIHSIAPGMGLKPQDLFDYALYHSKPCNTFKLSTQVGSSIARGATAIRGLLPTIRSMQAFLPPKSTTTSSSTDWAARLGLQGARLQGGTVPLGFTLAQEHAAQMGKMEDIVEITPSGQYKTRDGSLFQGEYWFQGCKNQWLVIQVNDSNAQSVNFEEWYNPTRHNTAPTVQELLSLAPTGPWTKVWDKNTGRPISSQAGRITLKLR